MTRKIDPASSEFALTARTRVRLRDAMTPARLFQGWGPAV